MPDGHPHSGPARQAPGGWAAGQAGGWGDQADQAGGWAAQGPYPQGPYSQGPSAPHDSSAEHVPGPHPLPHDHTAPRPDPAAGAWPSAPAEAWAAQAPYQQGPYRQSPFTPADSDAASADPARRAPEARPSAPAAAGIPYDPSTTYDPSTPYDPSADRDRAPEPQLPTGGRKAARLAREAERSGGGNSPRADGRRGRRRAGGNRKGNRNGTGTGTGRADAPHQPEPHQPQPDPHTPRPRLRRAGLVKAVAFCAAVVAASMLMLRGSEALDRIGGPAVPDSKAGAPAAPADAPDPGRVLQIVAHPDDDLYFMNPDLRYSISTGHPVTSVYLTSGEADGINAGAAKETTTPPNKPAYAEARQNGIRAAYAKMATGDRSSPWKRTAVPTKGGGQAEVDVLLAKPQVNLVWLQLREAGNVYADVPDSLHGLWDGKVARLESMLSSGTPVKQKYAYTKDQVIQTLVGVLEQYKPTTVRSQDPTPGRFADTKRYTDHQDHFYGARFVQMATAAYAKDVRDRPHFALQNYLGYFNGYLPSALDPDEAKEKLDILDTYAWLDRQNHCGSDAGCGDLKVADHPAGNRWSDAINYARGNSTSWLTSDREHGLWAFKVLDGQVAVWHRRGLVGPWSGPDLLPGTGMDPGVTTVTLGDGRIAAFGTRTSFGTRPADYKREVVYAVQKGPGAAEFGEWQSLGTPETTDETWTSDISAPAVSVDGAGHLAAYVRDGAGSLRGRVQQADGGWGPWEKHGGADLHGTPATATDGAGRRMVFCATSKTVLGWAQPKPGAPLGPVTATGLPDTTLPLTAQGREGGVRLWFRKPGSGNVRTALVTGDGGLKVNNLTDLGGLSGFGSVTASGHVLAGRAAGGQLGSEVGSGRPWERSPLMFVGAPSSTMTGRNMVSLAVVGLDARLYVTSSADAPDAHLAPWQPVGPRNGAP
ncbi:PIG-L family deacetylase [Streptomyces sp. NPDC005409]|uniref:PIG-L family deacetylase n=1 Tax=Streptomyces sp. NPDC005409 TaxID=3155342 RepID=UPI0034559336